MLFTEFRFLVFYLFVFTIYWTLRSNRARKTFLLAASCIFYGAWDYRFLSLVFFSVVLDYLVGIGLASSWAERDPTPRRRLLISSSLLGNLGLLSVFKYFNFFVTSGVSFLQALGIPVSARTLSIVLPVGISFYTFQTLSYTIDIYRGRLKPVSSLLDFSLFVAFFPHMVAGPIMRAADFLPQFTAIRRFAEIDVRAQLTLLLIGFVKKACLSDNLAPVVDAVFAAPGSHTCAAKWLGALLYAVQIYGDFSGYSDMAIALAGLLGYRLCLNFNFPYLAISVTEFWRRWHISLSIWFRDYLYQPLGGNRRGPGRTYLNLWLVFLLCGLWHGAKWTFVVWGLYHGLFLVLERISRTRGLASPPVFVARIYTLLVVLFGWVVFRSQSLGDAATYCRGLLGLGGNGTAGVTDAAVWWTLLLGLALVHAGLRRRPLDDRLRRLPDWGYALAYGAAVALVLPFVASEYQPFIYFQF